MHKMIKEHINIFIILAARAQKAGLIELNEMGAVAQAIDAAQKELAPTPKVEDVNPEQPAESNAKHGKLNPTNH